MPQTLTPFAKSFSIARIPRILFGSGVIDQLADIAACYGEGQCRALLFTGAHSFEAAGWSESVLSGLEQKGVDILHVKARGGEPSPGSVDAFVKQLNAEKIDVVIAIGGGSVLDEGKAIAGLLRVGDSVMDYLEGVGSEKTYRGPAVPFIAVPTTAGTGSEATKNAVLSVHGPEGFKKSFRSDALVAEWAVVDPDLVASCPPEILAGNGMDALTQLVESYVSTNANPMTQALALKGLDAVKDSLIPLCESNGTDVHARERMAFASLQSGICLAQTGLGSVHGLASPLGAFFPIPHGIVCGTLVAEATKVNIAALEQRALKGCPALDKYARVATILTGVNFDRRLDAHQALVHLLEDWTERLQLPRLEGLGLKESDLDKVVASSRGSSMQTNPIVLTDAEIRGILEERL